MFNTIEIKDVKQEIGDLVKIVRKQRKQTQIEVADALGVSRNTIQNLESGKNFTIDTLFKVCKEFNLLDKIYDGIMAAKKETEQTKSLY